MNKEDIKLTHYAHGSGCGCKIAPAVLQEIIGNSTHAENFPGLLVGNQTQDDAAIMQLDENTCLIATTDFFTPIVDNAFDFGRIAAANAISDVYAMGGKPILALAILGWPLDTLPASLAAEVIKGARVICEEVGIPLAGGHSIDVKEPIFGLSVNGLVAKQAIKKNSTAQIGDWIYLTKPLGTGILAAALKRGLLTDLQKNELTQTMCRINSSGALLSQHPSVNALTDVTGFGLGGHLLELCKPNQLQAEINLHHLPILKDAETFMAQGIMPDATFRNWNALHPFLELAPDTNTSLAFSILPDPQTNGGLLFSVKAEHAEEVGALFLAHGYDKPVKIGVINPSQGKYLRVLP